MARADARSSTFSTSSPSPKINTGPATATVGPGLAISIEPGPGRGAVAQSVIHEPAIRGVGVRGTNGSLMMRRPSC
eukprot:COSAG01_NODE_702_length_14141_cov_36.742739_4_plen_76_part_00